MALDDRYRDITKFNFNKCCIWIEEQQRATESIEQFNFNKCCIWITSIINEYGKGLYLTLTSVVFEFN